MNRDKQSRSLAAWAGAAILAVVACMVLSAALGKEGDGNDPFLAEVGNIGALVALAALLAIGAVALVSRVRARSAR